MDGEFVNPLMNVRGPQPPKGPKPPKKKGFGSFLKKSAAKAKKLATSVGFPSGGAGSAGVRAPRPPKSAASAPPTLSLSESRLLSIKNGKPHLKVSRSAFLSVKKLAAKTGDVAVHNPLALAKVEGHEDSVHQFTELRADGSVDDAMLQWGASLPPDEAHNVSCLVKSLIKRGHASAPMTINALLVFMSIGKLPPSKASLAAQVAQARSSPTGAVVSSENPLAKASRMVSARLKDAGVNMEPALAKFIERAPAAQLLHITDVVQRLSAEGEEGVPLSLADVKVLSLMILLQNF